MKAFNHYENFVIINKETGLAVQTDNELKAQESCKSLNDHEIRNNRPPVYVVVAKKYLKGETNEK